MDHKLTKVRKSVDHNVMKGYEADKGYVYSFIPACFTEALSDFFGMEHLDDVPTKYVPPTFTNDQKSAWVDGIFGKFIGQYIFPVCSED